MRSSELWSLLVAPFAAGLLVGALLFASGALDDRQEDSTAPDAATPKGDASESLLLRLEERTQDLRSELSRYDSNPLRELIERIQDSYALADRVELVKRIAAHDSEATRAVESALERARRRGARAAYQALLFEGTREERWLDALLATADNPAKADYDTYWAILHSVLRNESLPADDEVRILEFLSTRTPQEAGTAIVEYDCVGCWSVDRFRSAAAYYALIQRVRDYVLSGTSAGRNNVGALAAFSGEAYLVVLAKLLAKESLKLPQRVEVLEDHRSRLDALALWSPRLASSLPEGVKAEEWQRWLEEHASLENAWMGSDLVKVHGL